MFYDTSSTYREALTVSFFDRGPSCPTDRARSLFFLLRSFCSFYFLFWLVFFSLVPDCTTTQRKFSPAVKYPLFRCSVYLLGLRLCFSCSFPAPTPNKSSRLRWFFVDDHFITKMTTQEKPFQRPSPRRSFHDHLRKYGRSSQVLE